LIDVIGGCILRFGSLIVGQFFQDYQRQIPCCLVLSFQGERSPVSLLEVFDEAANSSVVGSGVVLGVYRKCLE